MSLASAYTIDDFANDGAKLAAQIDGVLNTQGPDFKGGNSAPPPIFATSDLATDHADLSDVESPDAVGFLPVRTLPTFATASPIVTQAPDAVGSIPDNTLTLTQVIAPQTSVPTVPATSSDILTQIMTPASATGTPVAAVQPPPHHTALFWAVILAALYFALRS